MLIRLIAWLCPSWQCISLITTHWPTSLPVLLIPLTAYNHYKQLLPTTHAKSCALYIIIICVILILSILSHFQWSLLNIQCILFLQLAGINFTKADLPDLLWYLITCTYCWKIATLSKIKYGLIDWLVYLSLTYKSLFKKNCWSHKA